MAIVSQLFIPLLFSTWDCVKITPLATSLPCGYASKSCPDTADEAKALVPSLILVLVPVGCGGGQRAEAAQGRHHPLVRRWCHRRHRKFFRYISSSNPTLSPPRHTGCVCRYAWIGEIGRVVFYQIWSSSYQRVVGSEHFVLKKILLSDIYNPKTQNILF